MWWSKKKRRRQPFAIHSASISQGVNYVRNPLSWSARRGAVLSRKAIDKMDRLILFHQAGGKLSGIEIKEHPRNFTTSPHRRH